MQGRDLSIGPGQPLVLIDPADGRDHNSAEPQGNSLLYISPAPSVVSPGGHLAVGALRARTGITSRAADMPTQTASTVAGLPAAVKTAGSRTARAGRSACGTHRSSALG